MKRLLILTVFEDENDGATDYPELLKKVTAELDIEESRLTDLQEELKVVKKYPDDETLDTMIWNLESDLKSLDDRIEKASRKKSISSESIDCLKNLTVAITKETDKRLKIVSAF
jgi:predicted  nucleic acid-binding Zn-ribbon protein